MHDPQTVAFEIKWPWYHTYPQDKTKTKYWAPLITVWHVDPERGGSDDSCGWSRPRLNKTQQEIVKWLAHDEAHNPWFMSLSAKENRNPVECETYVRGALLLVSRCLKNRGCIRREITLEQATTWASLLVHNGIDNLRSSLAWLSGYHGNNYHDDRPNTTEEDIWFRERSAEGFFTCLIAYILRERRHWWQHPRWHIVHWKRRREWSDEENKMVEVGWPRLAVGWRIQVHDIQHFKRWAFSRCCICGKGFKWGYAPTSNSWNGTGPLWFRSEQGVFHSACDDSRTPLNNAEAVEKASR